MPYASVNGIDLYYEENGKGFPLVLAHGAGGNHLSWWQQVPHYSRHYRTHHLRPPRLGPLGRHRRPRCRGVRRRPARPCSTTWRSSEHCSSDSRWADSPASDSPSPNPSAWPASLCRTRSPGCAARSGCTRHDDKREAVRAVWDRRRSDGIKRALAPDFATLTQGARLPLQADPPPERARPEPPAHRHAGARACAPSNARPTYRRTKERLAALRGAGALRRRRAR